MIRRNVITIALVALISTVIAGKSAAEDLTPLTTDLNGDNTVRVLSFGDSLTFGVGDDGLTSDAARKGGYPNRAESLLGILFDNEGLPGEELTDGGADRLLSLAGQTPDDYILVIEGANDAYREIDVEFYRSTLQRAVNAAVSIGKSPVLSTLPRPCCNHAAQVGTTVQYSSSVKTIALANGLPLIDLEKAWITTCENKADCDLYNLPEGLHPTAKGYDVIAQTVAARFMGIDIFAADGAAQLEQALSLAAGTVIVKPAATTTN